MSNIGAVVNFTKSSHHDTYPFISSSKADISGRSVLITGASKGIGRVIATSYATAGASTIILLARSSLDETRDLVHQAAKKADRAEPNVLTVKCDTTSEPDVTEAVKTVTEAVGKLDILINNAGYSSTWSSMTESDPSEWWRTWEVNVKGTYLISRAFIPLLLKTESGLKTIVSISSMGGVATVPTASAYQASKSAQIRLTNYLCIEHKEDGLLAYSIHPGGVKTELAKSMPEAMRNRILTDTPELAGDSLVWLTKERREWLMDRFISAAWDMEELEARKEEIVEKDLLKFKMDV